MAEVIADRSIAVLLATYNGEKYLGEQIESLLAQSCWDFQVFVHDDGSTDATMEIVERYSSLNPGFIIVLEDKERGRGARESFFWMMEQVDAQYYMFCDQDDVWLPFKIEHTFRKMKEVEEREPGEPVMIHTDLRIVDAKLNEIAPSYWKMHHFDVDLNRKFKYVVMGNVFTGCTMMMNSRVKDIVFPIGKVMGLHDAWIGAMTAKYGKVDNVKEATILYRQHGGNVISAGESRAFGVRKAGQFNFGAWYDGAKEYLDLVGYGGRRKAIFNKAVYTLIRLLRRK